MKPSHVGGRLDYATLAQLHRPADPTALAREAEGLMSQGLSARDVATALRLSLPAVLDLLTPGMNARLPTTGHPGLSVGRWLKDGK